MSNVKRLGESRARTAKRGFSEEWITTPEVELKKGVWERAPSYEGRDRWRLGEAKTTVFRRSTREKDK